MPSSDLINEYEWLRQELALIDQQVRELEQQHSLLVMSKESIDAVKGSANTELLVPAGAGVYFNGVLTSDSSCLVNVGSNVLIEMSVDKASKVISERVDQSLSLIIQLNEEAERLVARMNEINSLLQSGKV